MWAPMAGFTYNITSSQRSEHKFLGYRKEARLIKMIASKSTNKASSAKDWSPSQNCHCRSIEPLKAIGKTISIMSEGYFSYFLTEQSLNRQQIDLLTYD